MRDNKAQANAAVKEWVCHNREEYEQFKQQVKTHGGKHSDQRVIDELLTGNVE